MAAGILHEDLALVAPPACAACRVPLRRGGPRLCSNCARALPWLPARLCSRCALPSHPRGCPAARAAFSRAWAPLAYDGVARELVGALKFRGALPLAPLMAAHVAANLPPALRPGARAAIVPVPPDPGRRRRRGFDPVGALAAALAPRLGVPCTPCLRRRGSAARQVGASRGERRRAGRLRIEAAGAPPPDVLLVDDVHTTGATLDACARVLRAAGAGDVVALTYARTL